MLEAGIWDEILFLMIKPGYGHQRGIKEIDWRKSMLDRSSKNWRSESWWAQPSRF